MSKTRLFHSGREGKFFRDHERTYPTGCELLNLAVGVFDPITGRPGIPAATVVEAFGPNASLKTGLWESLAANIHKIDRTAKVFAVLTEEPDYDRFESVGIDLDRIFCWTYYNQDDPSYISSAEEGLNLMNQMVSEDMDIKLVVVDSIKALEAINQVFEKNGKDFKDLSEGEKIAARATLMNRFTGQFAVFNKSRAILFMVNQTSEAVGPSYLTGGSVKTQTSGGRGKEHWAKLRIDCQSTVPDATDKPEEHALFKNKLYGHYKVIYFLQKNKYGYPFRKVYCDFSLSEKRFMNEKNCLAIANFLDLVEKKGNHWKINGESINGKGAAEEYLAAHPEVEKELWEKIYPRHEEFFGASKSKSSKDELE